MEQRLTLDRAGFDAVIFDLDDLTAAGVLAASQRNGEIGRPGPALLDHLRQQGFALGAAAETPSALALLDAHGLQRWFHAVVSDTGTPGDADRADEEPAGLMMAARKLTVAPARAVAIAAGTAAVARARSQGFGLVVAVADAEREPALLDAGAHRIIRELHALRAGGAVLPASALAHVADIRAAASARHLAVLLDYDGTLTPITGRPQDANLDAATRSTLQRLAGAFTTAIISGRDLQDIRRRVGIDGIAYAGSHGLDILAADGTPSSPGTAETFLPALNDAERLLRRRLEQIDGAILERKRFAIAAHFRLVEEGREPEVEAAVDEALRKHTNLRKKHGKKVFEVLPDLDWDKGSALRWMIASIDANCFPLYIGDDLTDEDAFHAVRVDGVGIIVTSSPAATAARYRLSDPHEVRRFLEALAGPER